jgi:hypothetical protein
MIHGLSVTVAVHKSLRSLLEEEWGLRYAKNPDMRWKPEIFRKLFWILNFLALFLGGMTGPLQDVIWITDQDDILPCPEAGYDMVSLFTALSGAYIPHKMGHFRWGTTSQDAPNRSLEDIVAIPDLIAGAVSEFLTVSPLPSARDQDKHSTETNLLTPKASFLLTWLTTGDFPLKRMVCAMTPVTRSGVRVGILDIHVLASPMDLIPPWH